MYVYNETIEISMSKYILHISASRTKQIVKLISLVTRNYGLSGLGVCEILRPV